MPLCISTSDSWEVIVLRPHWQTFSTWHWVWKNNDCKYSRKTCVLGKCWNMCHFFLPQPVSEWQSQRGGVWLCFAYLCGDILLHWLLPFHRHTAWVQISQIKWLIEEYLRDFTPQFWHRAPSTVYKSSVEGGKKRKIFASSVLLTQHGF